MERDDRLLSRPRATRAPYEVLLSSLSRLLPVLLVTLLSWPNVSQAGLNQWTTNGPAGGDPKTVSALAVDPTTPQTVYAGTLGGGVFWSLDGGLKGCNIFQWDGTYVSDGGAVSFQAVLYDEVSQLVYQYATVDQTGTDSTTGVQDATGTDGVLYRCNVPDSIMPTTTAVSFLHPVPVPVELQTFTIE